MAADNQFGLFNRDRSTWVTTRDHVRRQGNRAEMDWLKREMERLHPGTNYEVRPLEGSLETK